MYTVPPLSLIEIVKFSNIQVIKCDVFGLKRTENPLISTFVAQPWLDGVMSSILNLQAYCSDDDSGSEEFVAQMTQHLRPVSNTTSVIAELKMDVAPEVHIEVN